MEIQDIDCDTGLFLDVFELADLDPIDDPLVDTMTTSSSVSGWRRLKSESSYSLPKMDPLWVSDNGSKMVDLDEDLDDEIYEQVKSALANSGIPNLKDFSISREELDAIAPFIKKILDLVTPTDEDETDTRQEKIGLLEQLGQHIGTEDLAAKNLMHKDIEELKSSKPLVCASGGKSKGLGHKVAKFWKKHKKEIIITAAVIAVIAGAVIVAAAISGSAAGVAAAGSVVGGAALADQGSKEKPHSKPDPFEIPDQMSSVDTISYPFKTFDPTAFPGKMIFGENGIYCDDKFTSYDETLKAPSITGHSWIDHWFQSIETSPSIAVAYQARGDWALNSGYQLQALQDFGKAIEMEPTDPASYLGRGVTHFELGQYDACIADYNQYTSFASKEFSVTDFSIGFAKGLPQGIYESGEGMLLFLTDLVTSPIQTGAQVYESFSTLSSLVKAGEWETIGSMISPELHELMTQWETLSDSKKGELAGFAFGKHGADILLPGAAVKVSSDVVKELGIVCKNLQSAEKVFVLEAVAKGSNAGIDIAEAMSSAERILSAGEDLGLTTKQMAEFKQAGTLEQTVGKGRDYFAGQPELQASYDKFEKVQEGLKPYKQTLISEAQIKDLIHQYDIPTFERPTGIPDNFVVKISDKGAGIVYAHPDHTYTSVRVMPGQPHSSFPHQQNPYVKHVRNGNYLDKFGNKVPENSPEAHIPISEYIYRGE